MSTLQIHMFPCLSDNYGFLIHDPDSGQTAAIDTPDGDEIAAQSDAKGWQLTEIWNTHWHPDHTGGNVLLKERYGCTVRAPGRKPPLPGVDVVVEGGDSFTLGTHRVDVIATPGHTLEHVVFHVPNAGACFVGDTIFTLGCGRLFEGTAQQMWESFGKVLALPEETKLYCAHEYTMSNAKFAQAVDGGLPALEDAVARYAAMRERGEATVPTTVGAERATNPFWLAGSAAVLGERRSLKDSGKF